MTASTAAAQLTVAGRQSLAFGVTLRGVNRSVAPGNAFSAGQYYVLGQLGGVIRLRFTLPSSLARVGGGSLRITFASSDALYRTTGAGATTTVFNPSNSRTVTLTTSPDIYVQIGGTIRPTASQATGTYTGTILLTVTII